MLPHISVLSTEWITSDEDAADVDAADADAAPTGETTVVLGAEREELVAEAKDAT